MPRRPRLEAPGYYHVVSRGNNKQPVFDDAVRRLWPGYLAPIVRDLDWLVYAWALMDNHFHMVVQIGEAGLSAGMQRLNLNLARASNARFGRIDHCFGDRFRSSRLETDQHLFASIRYTLWNPARAGVGEGPRDCGWTSYPASVGLEWQPAGLALPRLLEHFGSSPRRAQRAFRQFIGEGRDRCLAPWRDTTGILR